MIVKFFKKFCKSSTIIALIILPSPFIFIFLIYRKYLKMHITQTRIKCTGNGINILEAIKIGGIEQWISVRGEDKENPILLILPGGPGMSMMPFSFIFQPLESQFNIVHWDQRGVGKTYASNRTLSLETINIKQMQNDTLEIAQYLCRRFKQEKIFVFGHSWGSFLGLSLAHAHPELLQAYIGAGQFINMKANEKYGYEHTLKTAQEKNNKKALKALAHLDPNNLTMEELLLMRKWQFRLNPFNIKKLSLFSILVKALSEPAYTLLDYFKLIRGISFLMKSKQLYNEILNINLEDRIHFQIPIFIFGGRKDPITPAYPVYQYFEKINSPHKEHIWFENSGHNCFFEETEKFFHCINTIRTMLKLSRNGV